MKNVSYSATWQSLSTTYLGWRWWCLVFNLLLGFSVVWFIFSVLAFLRAVNGASSWESDSIFFRFQTSQAANSLPLIAIVSSRMSLAATCRGARNWLRILWWAASTPDDLSVRRAGAFVLILFAVLIFAFVFWSAGAALVVVGISHDLYSDWNCSLSLLLDSPLFSRSFSLSLSRWVEDELCLLLPLLLECFLLSRSLSLQIRESGLNSQFSAITQFTLTGGCFSSSYDPSIYPYHHCGDHCSIRSRIR